MLDAIFLQVLNMSFTASFVILFVLIARLLLKRAPKVFSYSLWGVVLFRLICPFSFESILSLLPVNAKPIPEAIVYAATPEVDTGLSALNRAVNSIFPAATPNASANPMQITVFLGRTLWLLGIAILFCYSVVSLFRLKKRLKGAVHESGNIYLSDTLGAPFVLGFIAPKIYLPSSLKDEEKQHILLHEQTHIHRQDHIIKMLSFFVLCLHWFNPLVWAAFFLSGKDMEMACDEAVIKRLGSGIKKNYSASLLAFAAKRHAVCGVPLAFGEGSAKSRIKNILRYKKPVIWVLLVLAAVVLLLSFGLFLNPLSSSLLLNAKGVNILPESLKSSIYGALAIDAQAVELSASELNDVVEFIIKLSVGKTETASRAGRDVNSSSQIHLVYEGFGKDGALFNLYFYFNSDFSLVWADNDIKPSPVYKVKKPQEAKDFIMQFFNFANEKVNSAEDGDLARYSVSKYKSGVVYESYPLDNTELVKAIVMDSLLKSTLLKGADVEALEEYYLIEQVFPQENERHEYYVYMAENSEPVVQFDKKGMCTKLSSELYYKLEERFP